MLSVSDYWFWFEFQHRGSCHLHGLLWISDAPDFRTFDNATDQEILMAKNYYNGFVSAWNPSALTPALVLHQSRLRSTDVILDDDLHVSELLNRFQRRTRCINGYCFKYDSKEYTCRFKYPKHLQDQSVLQKDE